MPFDDLDDDAESDPGGDALNGLADTLSGKSEPEQQEQEEEVVDESPAYDPETEPAFPTAKKQTQHSIYCLPVTWEDVDGASGLLFEAEIKLRREGYESIQKRELHNALLRAAAVSLTPEDVARTVIETRDARTEGSLLNDD